MSGTDELYDDVEEIMDGIVDTGGLDDYVAPEIPRDDEYKFKVMNCELKTIEWDKDGEHHKAELIEATLKIIDSEYKNPVSVRHTLWMPKYSLDANAAKGKIIRFREAMGDAEPTSATFDPEVYRGVEFYATIGHKANKKDKERTDLFIRRFTL